jgi:hypothetical protein
MSFKLFFFCHFYCSKEVSLFALIFHLLYYLFTHTPQHLSFLDSFSFGFFMEFPQSLIYELPHAPWCGGVILVKICNILLSGIKHLSHIKWKTG